MWNIAISRLRTGVAARAAVDVGVELADHSQRLLVRGVDLVRVVPQLADLLVCVAHDARARPVMLPCQNNPPLHSELVSKPIFQSHKPLRPITGRLGNATTQLHAFSEIDNRVVSSSSALPPGNCLHLRFELCSNTECITNDIIG